METQGEERADECQVRRGREQRSCKGTEGPAQAGLQGGLAMEGGQEREHCLQETYSQEKDCQLEGLSHDYMLSRKGRTED